MPSETFNAACNHQVHFEPDVERNDKGGILFQGGIFYTDAFGVERETRFGGFIDHFCDWWDSGLNGEFEGHGIRVAMSPELNSAT